jgi:transposase
LANRQQGTPVMLPGMTQDDWAITSQVFAAAQPRRGQPGRNDRNFLEALQFFTVHDLTWRALPATFAAWNSIAKRFWRLRQTGVFEAFFQLLAETSKTAHLVQMLDRTVVRAHVSAAAAKGGQKNPAPGRSRGGFSSKIHRKTDHDGRPIAFHLTGGEVSDSTQLATSLDTGPDITPRAAMTGKGYDAKSNRAACRQRGIVPVIRHRSNTKNKPSFFPKRRYRRRARIEPAIGKLKRFKRIAMRCEKPPRTSQLSWLLLAG